MQVMRRINVWCRYEGPQCDMDINECVRGTHNCAGNSTCINTEGSFNCICWRGFIGQSIHLCSCTLPQQLCIPLDLEYRLRRHS